MPDQAANLANFRKGGHVLRAHLSFYVGRLVHEMEVETTPTFPATLIKYTNVTAGDWADMKPGFRVDFFTSDGRFKGRTRMRFWWTEDLADYLPIRETSRATIPIVAGDIIRVYRDLRLSDKLVEANESFSPEGIPFSGHGDTPPPLPTSGGAWAGKTSMLPVIMTGTGTALVDPDSSTPATHLWATDGLTYSSGTSTSASPQLTGVEGEYLVEHSVTDPDNGESITQYVPVVIDDHPYKVIVESLPTDEARGGSARVRMLENATLTDVPDGALGILWKEEYIAGVRQSFGARAPGRSHILFVGILRREEGEFDGDDGAEGLTFELISPLARLEELMGYGKVMLREASPNAWNEVKALSVRRGIIQIPLWYSTLIESGYDLVFTGTFKSGAYSGFFLDQMSPLGQMRELADGTEARLIEDRRGRFEVQMRPERVALSARAALTVTLSMTGRDVKRWRYTREHWRSVNRLEMRGFIAGATNGANLPIFSQYPGDAPGEGNQQTIHEKKIADSQAHLNEMCGRAGGALDGVFFDADGVQQQALDLELVLRGAYDVFDLYDELIALDVQTTRRGLDFSQHKFVLVSTSLDFHDGTVDTNLRLRTCTNAPEGVTFIPKASDTPYLPDPGTLFPPTLPPSYGNSGLTRAAPFLYAFDATSAKVWKYTRQTGLWELAFDLAAGGMSGTLVDATWRVGGNIARLFTTAEVRRLNNYSSGTPALGTATALTNFTVFGVMNYERGAPDWGIAASYKYTVGVRVAYTVNDTSWSQVTVTAGYDTTPGSTIPPGLFIDPHTPGHAYLTVYTNTATGGSLIAALYETTNYGASWALCSDTAVNPGNTLAASLHVPYRIANGKTVYYTKSNGATPGYDPRLMKVVASGTPVDISPDIAGEKYAPLNNRSIASADDDANSLLFVGITDYAGSGTFAAFLTRDAGLTWVTLQAPTAYRRVYFVNRETAYLIGAGGAVGFFDGAQIIDLSITGGGELVALMGA